MNIYSEDREEWEVENCQKPLPSPLIQVFFINIVFLERLPCANTTNLNFSF